MKISHLAAIKRGKKYFNMQNNKYTPELKNAINQIKPEYFAWGFDAQEKYRVGMPDEDTFKFNQFLFKELFNISVSDKKEFDEMWDDLDSEQYLKFNSTMLPVKGIGKDLFSLNEYLSAGKNILHYNTLYDYDLNDFKFQEEHRKKDIKDYQLQLYTGSLTSSWARLMINNSFSYGILSMVADYIYCEVEEFGTEHIDKLIPHEFKEGKNHGKPVGENYIHDMYIDANGLEEELKDLNELFRNYLSTLYEKLKYEFDNQSAQKVYILDISNPNDPCHHFLFTDKEILKEIHFKYFMDCCRSFEENDHSSLLEKVIEEKKLLKDSLIYFCQRI